MTPEEFHEVKLKVQAAREWERSRLRTTKVAFFDELLTILQHLWDNQCREPVA